MAEEKKRGGFRQGSGRKTTGERGKTSNICFRISPEEKAIIDAKAKAAGKTTSRYMIDLALNA
ncbi:MAG: DUF1778 domain-containing protein [Treponema sp.]|nr:DUF1778 domain-containing protein [Treponema sp.]